MYIKAKKGYNIILNDIDLALYGDRDFRFIDDEKFNQSEEAKRLSAFIETSETLPEKEEVHTNMTQVKNTADGVFVLGLTDTPKKSDAIIMDPNGEVDPRTAKTVQTINEQEKATAKVEAKTKNETKVKDEIKVETPVKKEIVQEEVKTEIKNEPIKIEEPAKADANVKAETKVEVEVETKTENELKVNNEVKKAEDKNESKKDKNSQRKK